MLYIGQIGDSAMLVEHELVAVHEGDPPTNAGKGEPEVVPVLERTGIEVVEGARVHPELSDRAREGSRVRFLDEDR